ncbi:hypothetical protein CEXT_748491 [Caerostris extrusa]|uniref:Uncharacterized protein n=1 Tax=Caerostris extrusa TaxID=172846 RepID=A0AAV4N8K4_CAEEX|nr:hypothetical protein CEXT_748491 [Caerostris extrusa]
MNSARRGPDTEDTQTFNSYPDSKSGFSGGPDTEGTQTFNSTLTANQVAAATDRFDIKMNTVLLDDDDYIDDYLSSCPPAIDQDVRFFLLSSVSKYRKAGMGIMMTQSAK